MPAKTAKTSNENCEAAKTAPQEARTAMKERVAELRAEPESRAARRPTAWRGGFPDQDCRDGRRRIVRSPSACML